jgi:hypothetical protein
MTITAQTKTIEIQAYTDNDEPCCAKDFIKGEVCIFFRTKNFGVVECCAIDPDIPLARRSSLGTLIPIPECIVWGVKVDANE